MDPASRAFWMLNGAICGAFVGVMLGFFGLAWGGAAILGREFYQVGWVFLFITVPGGALVGGFVGGWAIDQRPRFFLLCILPLALLFGGYLATFSILGSIDRPRLYTVEVKGTAGAKYYGVLEANGQIQKVNGLLPARFEVETMRLDLAMALFEPVATDVIGVEVLANGESLHTGHEVPTGVEINLKSVGYSEFVGGTSSSWHWMSAEETHRMLLGEWPVNLRPSFFDD